MITCPMPGSVCRVLVKNGEKVKKGDIVVVIEAMKMEHSITAPRDGVLEIGELAEKQFLKKGQSIFRVIFYVCWKRER
ncbi:Pyruvate Carboxylase (subunit ?) [Blastocystis hominis]|uniref:Pyruvate Carboxylase (Subunit ?) n=1 Tax=Blastocystis hominis TaxID=12968 RepID=D8M7R2_BLAHO|nr:Pyruvate Carboxylase (subunit ?) [Blastocystis hominis]CBK24101.2 Pyruvate Carboxylase (subunit ?) [Blastocystis hominis]|eukprot:XP_012898149.1 Pyruvate Carboxylase (subunit ?) [Blastocystis hominis]